MKAVVKDIIHSEIAAFHNEGLQLFECLQLAIKNNEPVEISFIGIERCATQFLNSSIGKIYLMYNPKIANSLISYDYGNLTRLPQKIEEVIENAINSKEYDSWIENATA